MNKYSLYIATLVSIFFITGNVQAERNAPIVKDGNIDGGARILKIHCPSGKRTTVRMYLTDSEKPQQTCIYRTDGSDLCKENWDHDEAAVSACNQK